MSTDTEMENNPWNQTVPLPSQGIAASTLGPTGEFQSPPR